MKAPKFNAAAIVAAAFVLMTTSLVAADTTPRANDVTPQFASANLPISGFQATEVGGIVVLRGTATDSTDAARAGQFATTMGYPRVANLIRVIERPDDAAIERTAERQLSTRSLDGCDFHIASDRGIVSLTGTVQYELQKDIAVSLLRNVDGVREVRAQLVR